MVRVHAMLGVLVILLSLSFMSWGAESGPREDVKKEEAPDHQPRPEDVASAVRSLSSQSRAERNRGILWLATHINRGDLKNLEDKAALFAKASTSTDIAFAYKLATVLAMLPKDLNIVIEAREALKGTKQPKLIAAIAYLERHEPKAVEEYFKNKEYSALSESIKQVLAGSLYVVALKEQYIAATLGKYLAWTPGPPSKAILDKPNPFHGVLLEERRHVVAYVMKNKERFSRPKMDLGMVWLLGEIGDSRSFELLLSEYRSRPNYRTAVSLAACTGSLQIDPLLKSLSNEELAVFMKEILGPEGFSTIKGFTRQKISEYWKGHFAEIHKRCVQRSIPQLG